MPRGSIAIDPSAEQVGAVREILVASLREPATDTAFLSTERSRTLRYFDFAVSVPPERALGTVSFPPASSPPDPERHFVTVSAREIGQASGFEQAVNRKLAPLPRGQREVLVFAHGFNNTFAEGLYRHAQMSHDFGSAAVSVSFAWPSAASATRYANDRESVLFARDGFERLLASLSRTDADRIIVVGHSMGAHLVMETLRQIDIRGSDHVLDKITSVVLLSPDIDLDVFLKQADLIARYDVPIFVFSSSDDRALFLSSRLRRGSARLGSLRDGALFGELPIYLIDLTDVPDDQSGLKHFKAATSPTLIDLVDGMGTAGLELLRDANRRPTFFEAGALTVQGLGTAISGTPVN